MCDSINRNHSNTFYQKEPFRDKSLKFNRNRYSFVPYNTFSLKNRNYLSNYNKIHITPCKYNRETINFYPDSRYQDSLYLFGSLKTWFRDKILGWYVPPLPIGEKVSVKLMELGPLQTDAETKEFLDEIGANECENIFDVIDRFRFVMDQKPRNSLYLSSSCREFLRKALVQQFEQMENVASKGFTAWKEYWKPTKEELEEDPDTLTKEDKQFLSWWPESMNAEQVLRDVKKKRRSIYPIETTRYKGLIRVTKDFKGRFNQCLKTMFPLMALGLVPELGPLSIGISSILASKIIYKGDPKDPEENKMDYTRYVSAKGYDRSETIKTIATMLVVTVHSMLGYFMSCMAIAHTKLGSFIPSEMINSFFINLQLTLSALIYDTSEMTYKQKVEMLE